MKHLLSILILFGFVSVVTAEETHLLCKGEEEIASYGNRTLKAGRDKELDISLDKQEMWLIQWYGIKRDLYKIVIVKDDIIVGLNEYPPNKNRNKYLQIDRITGELVQFKIKEDGSADEFFSAKCELVLEKLF